ncbi:MAG: hypothetical protein WB791_10885 [Waddliaceae bacterium]
MLEEVQDSDIDGKQVVREKRRAGKIPIDIQKKHSPKYRLKIGEAVYYLSQPGKDKSLDGRISAHILIENNDNAQLDGQVVYFSKSQGIWRTIPSVPKKNNEVEHIGKGIQESDVALPAIVNILLMELMKQNLSKHQMSINLFQTANLPFVPPFNYLNRVSPLPAVNNEENKNTILENNDAQPNFDDSIVYDTVNDLYNEVRYHLYLSRDKKFIWTFCELKGEMMKGRTFLASVDCIQSPITNYGNRLNFVIDKCVGTDHKLTAPLLEYQEQMDQQDRPKLGLVQGYQWNWNYVRKNPLVQQWYRHQEIGVYPRLEQA